MVANRRVAAECGAGLARWDQTERRLACLTVPRKLRPNVGKTVHAISSRRAPLSPVLPGSALWFVDACACPWLLLSHQTAENLQRPFLFEPIFSRVYLMLSRARPARLSIEQAAVVQRSNLQALAAHA